MKNGLIVLAVATYLLPGMRVAAQTTSDLKKLSVDQLLDMQVTSVSKRSERLADAPAAIFVITAEDIRRSGASTLPEALRLAPNLQVARLDTVQYAISARGFNNAIGNKLLVLVDGRTVYTPLFSGVFWDQQEVMLEDVDRIEVISGPGATLWGANAVNGVINVITRSAAETTGTLLVARTGDNERGGAVRFGEALDSGAFRVYAKYSQWDHTDSAGSIALPDEWSRGQAGFRADWDTGDNAYTLQGDAYDGRSEDRGVPGSFALSEVRVSGMNLVGRWERELSGGSQIRLQAYVDHSERDDPLFYSPEADVFDIDFQQAIPGVRHRVLWGGGYRHGRDDIGPGLFTTFVPASRSLQWGNVFAQDEIGLRDDLQATLGIKLERNDYTGVEYLPSARLAWKLSPDRLLWGSLSRAVRAPARYDRDVRFPGSPPHLVIGGPHFRSEVANVAEFGYRAQRANALSYSVTGFAHFWDKLRSGTAVPVELENKIEGTVYGLEAWAEYRPAQWWVLTGGITYLQEDLRLKSGSTDPVGVENPTLRNDPDHQWTLGSGFDLPRDVRLDLHLRGVSSLPEPAVPAYTELDLRLAWVARENIELSIIGRNLLHARHAEYGDALVRSELERNLYGQIRWQF